MASKYWIKLYHEILHDPKMGKLPDGVWRRAIEMFLLAGELDDDGQLPPIADMAWTLRLDEGVLRKDLDALVEAEIVIETDGHWVVTNYTKRQSPSSTRPQSAIKAWRTAIFARDDYICQGCGSRGVKLQAHHIVPWYLDHKKRFDLSNGITLCRKCHHLYHLPGWKHRAEGRA